MSLERFLKIRRPFEVGFWCALLLLVFVTETLVEIIDVNRHGLGTQNWEVVTWQGSSILVLLLLIPLVIYFDRRFPWRWKNLKIVIPAHILFSLLFSILHVGAMVFVRKIIYWLSGSNYDFGNTLEQFFYEYLKDIRSYGVILSILYLYRHLVLRLQGEASLLANNELDEKREIDSKSERILVKKLGREFLVKVQDIECIEAAGNYVNLHMSERIYPLRETLKNILQRLDSSTFKRIHRSHIINLNHIKEIKPLETGDAQVLLTNGRIIPMSRTYRSQFNEHY